MKKKKRRHYNTKTNKTRNYMIALLAILVTCLIVGVVYSNTKPKKHIPDEVANIVNQSKDVDGE